MKIPIDNRIANEMYEAAARSSDKKRRYLGMSEIGNPCERKLWLSFRGFQSKPIEGRSIMIFRLGDLVEAEVIKWLRMSGYTVESQQDSYSDFGGFFRGHCDGVIHGVTHRPHVLEVKSANAERFKGFRDYGVQAISQQYYAQIQCYMGYSNLERALFVVMNKNTSEIHTERLRFNEHDFEKIREKAHRVIVSEEVPEPTEYMCEWCDQKLNCEGRWLMGEQICGTCAYLGWDKLTPVCRHKNHAFEIKEWGLKCDDYLWIAEKIQIITNGKVVWRRGNYADE